MHSVEEAVERLLDQSRLLTRAAETPLGEMNGRVLAQGIIAPVDVPPADNSAMDGYALRHQQWQSPDSAMAVSQRIPAGTVPGALAAGTAARIFTGAEIPPGADTVVMQEHTDGGRQRVRINKLPGPGANIRPRGQDIRAGDRVLGAGHRLRPQDVGLIASLGIAAVNTYRPLKVALISSGNELVEPGESAGPGRIYNSNRHLLNALMRAWHFEVLDLGIAADEPEAIREKLSMASSQADVIVTSGGVSVGEEDHIRQVVSGLGAIDLWKIAIKPGKPFAFGRCGATPFIGLPGNPSSVLVTALIIARPFLLASQGQSQTGVVPFKCPAMFERPSQSRTEYIRARLGTDGVESHPQQSSGALMSTVWGDGLAIHPRDTIISKGDLIDFLPYSVLL